jgi:myo-inositol 2-dehydrogenase/D-chiro-inositol 1-dehydrogenase
MSAKGDDEMVPPETVPVHIGVMGCGRAAAGLHLPALAQIPGVKVTALADVNAERLKAVSEKWRIERRYGDYRELIADPSVELLLIAVPTRFHEEAFLAASASGKHIYLEKPIALDLCSADRILAAAERSPGRTAVGFNLRSHRLAQKARQVIRSGGLGRILLVRTVMVGNVRDRPDWQLRRAEGGGVVYELGVHHFDLWNFLLDAEVEHVESCVLADVSQDSRAAVSARMGNGILASSVLALQGAATNEVEVIGEAGSLRFSMYRGDSFELQPSGRATQLARWCQGLPEAVQAARRGGDYRDSYRIHWQRFLDSIRGGESPATLQDGREALRIALEAMAWSDRVGPT